MKRAFSTPASAASCSAAATKRGAPSTPPAAPQGPAGRAHELRDPLRRVAEAAADVEHALPRTRREQAQRGFAVLAEARYEDLAELDEAVEERAVPGDGGLFVDTGPLGRA